MNLNQILDQKIKRDKEAFLEFAELVEEAKVKEKIIMDDKLIPTMLRPYFISKKQNHILKQETEVLAECLETVSKEYKKNKQIKKVIGLTKKEDELVQLDLGHYRRNVPINMLDCYFNGDDFKITEFNTDSPMGTSYISKYYNKILKRVAPMKYWLEHENYVHLDPLAGLEQEVKLIWQNFAGSSSLPVIAWVDWKDAKSSLEFRIEMEYFSQRGYQYISADPKELVYKKGGLYKRNTKIDMIRRRAMVSELAEHFREIVDLIKAIRNFKVCLFNPLASKTVSNKTALHVLTHPDFQGLFTKDQLTTINRYVPTTRYFKKTNDDFGKFDQVDLVKFTKQNKNKLVLKPRTNITHRQKSTQLHGGQNICVGKMLTQTQWNKTITQALKQGWVVQELIKIPKETLPFVRDNKLEFNNVHVKVDSYVLGGKYSGSSLRTSISPVFDFSSSLAFGTVCAAK